MTHTVDWSIIVGHLVLLITTLAGFIAQWWREERRHRWQLERDADHAAKTATMAKQLEELHKELKS